MIRNGPVTRETLYEDVWAAPMTKIAASYGVSSSFLAHVCARLNVPRPPRGYWAKLAVGKAPKRPVLPDARPGDELEWPRDGESVRATQALPKPPAAKPMKRVRSRANHSGDHGILVGALAHFDGARENDGDYLKPNK